MENQCILEFALGSKNETGTRPLGETMQRAEDKERGLLASQVKDQVFRLASEEARRLSSPQKNVQRIGNRFGVAWGLKLGPLHYYFLVDRQPVKRPQKGMNV